MKISEFRHYAELYGSDINQWPEILKKPAYEMVESNALANSIITEEKAFELSVLRTPIPADDNFCQRIISIALTQPYERKLSIKDKAMLIFIEVRNSLQIPQPAYTFAAIALIGFIFGVSSAEAQVDTDSSLGNILYDSEGVL